MVKVALEDDINWRVVACFLAFVIPFRVPAHTLLISAPGIVVRSIWLPHQVYSPLQVPVLWFRQREAAQKKRMAAKEQHVNASPPNKASLEQTSEKPSASNSLQGPDIRIGSKQDLGAAYGIPYPVASSTLARNIIR